MAHEIDPLRKKIDRPGSSGGVENGVSVAARDVAGESIEAPGTHDGKKAGSKWHWDCTQSFWVQRQKRGHQWQKKG